ncbi:MAG: Si-specific NAD(P)(+) transhydrogenase [Elusimicrobia bacterium]|nr:Si-specific NAD(P)(+) transhydrogenase [Elusimicrobiota bacterium]
MPAMDFDVFVIGSGPGGEGAAMQAVKAGKSVALAESYHEVGGGCTHWATIPSKSLRHTITHLAEFRSHPFTADCAQDLKVSFPDLVLHAQEVIHQQVAMRRGFHDRNGVRLLHGRASFIDPHTVAVEDPAGKVERFTAAHVVIAAGSRPYRPPELDFSQPRVRDSDTILSLDHTPGSITIYGAGVVGCEYASMFCGLGLKVNLVNTRDRLLSFLDDEIIDAIKYHLRDQGAIIRHNEPYERVEASGDGVILHLKSGQKLKTDVILWANGRTGNSDKLGLEAVGLSADARGNLKVNESYQTAVPHIYAVGDITGPPALASAAYDQGRLAATHIVQGRSDERLARFIPTGIYTTPEISSLGRTERELAASGVPYEAGHSLFRNLARAQISGHTVGMLKVLFHRKTYEILGIHCFGAQAAEIIHIGQAVMMQKGGGNDLRFFINTTFNYPTMAEAYRVAALNGINRLV